MPDDPPPRRSPFAVWHWPGWTWALLVMLMIDVYLISASPLLFLAFQIDHSVPPNFRHFTDTALPLFEPARICGHLFPPLSQFYDWEWSQMENAFEVAILNYPPK